MLLALLALLCPLAASCISRDNKPDRAPIFLVISGDTGGWIVPCGCTTNQSGGLLRRATALNEIRAGAEAVYVDAGGAASGTARYDRMKLEAILSGEVAMGVAAHNIGAAEAQLGPAYLREVGARLAVPWVSCNVFDAAGEPIADPLRRVTAGGWRLAIVGVLSDRQAIPGVTIEPPRESISAVLQQRPEEYDALIVLAYLDKEELEQLAHSLPEADVLVGGPTVHAIAPRRLGPVLVTSATNKGKFLAILRAPAAGAVRGWDGELVELNEQYADDLQQRENLQRFYAALESADLAAQDTSFVQRLDAGYPPDYRVAGDASCRECHLEDSQRCDQSRHAHAWESLRERGAHVDPYCQQCHTTGFGLPGGFESARRSPALVNVGCESCHGPSLAHQRDPQVRTTRYGQAQQHCVSCHDRENSPEFAYEKYWGRIRHGAPATQPERPDATSLSRYPGTADDGGQP